MADLDLQELIQHSLKGTSPEEASKVVRKAELSPQMGLFGEEPEEPQKVKKEAGKRETTPAKRSAQTQTDMFEKDFKELKRAEAEKNFKAQQKLEDRPLPKHQRASSARGGGGGGMSPADIEKVPGKRLLKMKKGGSVSTASRRADGCAVKGKTKGRMV